MRHVSRDWVLGLLITAAGAVLTLPLEAQIPSSNGSGGGVIIACAQNNGQLRLISPGESCKRNEQRVSWNIRGPRGLTGPAGANGSPGVPGKDGAPGRDGRDGRDGGNGSPGAPGKEGASGKDGMPGNQGPEGPRGPQGPQGAQGEPGAGIDLGRIVGKAIDRCLPFQGFVVIPGLSVTAWTDATGHFDLRHVPPGNHSVAFLNATALPATPVIAGLATGDTVDLGLIELGACTPINACDVAPSPCGPNGTCTTAGPGTFSCDCEEGYTPDASGACVPIPPPAACTSFADQASCEARTDCRAIIGVAGFQACVPK